MELVIKHRRGELILTENDTIMDNGFCFQLITQNYYDGFGKFPYELSKTTCKKLIKDNKIEIASRDNEKELNYYKLVKDAE